MQTSRDERRRALSLPCVLMIAVIPGTVIAGNVTLRKVALSGDPAPSTAEAFRSIHMALINADGAVAIHASVNSAGPCGGTGDPPPQDGIWSEKNGVLELVAAPGVHAPGTDPMVTFRNVASPQFNDRGQSLFVASLTGFDATGNCVVGAGGMWSGGQGSLALVAGTGSAVPGVPGGVFRGFYGGRLNDTGQAAFQAVLTDDSTGIWSEAGGSLALVAHSGSQAPGMEPGVVFVPGFDSGGVLINASGQTAFRASARDPGVSDYLGIWIETAGVLELAFRNGSPAPGTQGLFFQGLGSPRLNDAGQLAFLSVLAGPGVGPANNRGIWSTASGLVARTGTVAPGTSTTFSSLHEPALNSAGQVAFSALTDPGGSGIWAQQPSGELALVARAGGLAPGTGDVFAGVFNPAINAAGHTAFWASLSGAASGSDTGIWAHNPAGQLTLIVREGDAIEVATDDVRVVDELGMINGAEAGVSTGYSDSGQVAFWAAFTDGSIGAFVASFCSEPDSDGDGLGDACDACLHDPANDVDGDGWCGNVDNCGFYPNANQSDTDGDGVGDVCDNCSVRPNASQSDGDGEYLEQWAVTATASSEYTSSDYSAMQAAGEPESTGVCVDAPTNWSPLAQSADPEWLELTYLVPVRPVGVDVHESLEERFVHQIDLRDASGAYHPVWTGTDDTTCGEVLETRWGITPYIANRVVVHTAVAGWEEIDAVELLGVYEESDGIGNACDNCPEHTNITQADSDGDGAGDACDCDMLDPAIRPAAEVDGVMVESPGAGALRLSWLPTPGAAFYAVIRGELSTLSVTNMGECRVGGLSALAWEDAQVPTPGAGFTYLVRGESPVCGPGTLGFGAYGRARTQAGSECP